MYFQFFSIVSPPPKTRVLDLWIRFQFFSIVSFNPDDLAHFLFDKLSIFLYCFEIEGFFITPLPISLSIFLYCFSISAIIGGIAGYEVFQFFSIVSALCGTRPPSWGIGFQFFSIVSHAHACTELYTCKTFNFSLLFLQLSIWLNCLYQAFNFSLLFQCSVATGRAQGQASRAFNFSLLFHGHASTLWRRETHECFQFFSIVSTM